MKSDVWPPVLFMVSVISMLLFFTAVYPWEMYFVLVPLICLVLFYVWLDNNDQP